MVALQIISKVARSGCHFVLEMMGYVVRLALLGSQDHISPQTQKLLSDLPVDPETAAKQFHLDGKNTIYATCPNPSCHQTYKPIYHDGCPIAEYPGHCTHKRAVISLARVSLPAQPNEDSDMLDITLSLNYLSL